jgi:simple sugar transport system permease protein
MVEAILITVITASTPILIAAIGELVAERSGVLNLGVEGMMVLGSACGFAVAVSTGSAVLGILAAVAAGTALSALFAVATLGLAANQVASGLALTILGLGLAGLIGAPYVGAQRAPLEKLDLPGLTDLPVVGPLVFGQDGLVYASLVLVAGVAWFLARTRAGLRLRAVGENHESAHALGFSVLKIRLGAVLFGGACAGLAGAYLSLAYTPFWSPGMSGGRGWIALAVVVFASWRPGRALAGAYLFGAATILQLHAQGAGLGIPPQVLSALPYVVTILALVVISRARAGGQAPASLGVAFVPER